MFLGGADPRNEENNEKNPSVINTVWSFDPVTRKWFNEKSMFRARKNFGLVACSQTLFAIGGQGERFE